MKLRHLLCLGAMVLLAAAPALPDEAVPEGMVLVPAGKFVMGTDRSDAVGPNIPRFNNDARPQHTVELPAFLIDKLDVTNSQYKKFCDATNYPVPPVWAQGSYPEGQGEFPATYINWWEAAAYAAWAGKRLPTEAEWEKTARGSDGRLFPWGNNWDRNLAVVDAAKPEPVGSKPAGASSYGALDMAGNVFQWVQDWYDAYPDAPLRFPQYGKQFKVIRGGSFWTGEQQAAGFYRCVARQATRSQAIGFRCARDVPKPPG